MFDDLIDITDDLTPTLMSSDVGCGGSDQYGVTYWFQDETR
jgi:hypothetical protein